MQIDFYSDGIRTSTYLFGSLTRIRWLRGFIRFPYSVLLPADVAKSVFCFCSVFPQSLQLTDIQSVCYINVLCKRSMGIWLLIKFIN